MERMDMHSRNEYLKVLKKGYFKAGSEKEKSQILDEYCRKTGQSRKYVITKIHKADLRPRQRKRRKEVYDGQVKAALAKIWEIFDYPCGQRLKPLLEAEVDRLRELGEIEIADEVALKLKMVGSEPLIENLSTKGDFSTTGRRSLPRVINCWPLVKLDGEYTQ